MKLTVNPVLARELKERMRGLWAFVAMMVFLGLLTLTVWVVYEANQATSGFGFELERQTRLGRDLFEWVLSIMLVLVLFFVPGLTAGAVAGERERQTLLPLQITLLRPRHILWGKVMASLAYLTLLVVASTPILAVAYRLGGVTIIDALVGLASILAVGVLLATMVVGISAFAKRVQSATLIAYGFTLVLSLASFIAYGTVLVIDDNRGVDPTNAPAVLLLANPIVFLADATAGQNIDVGQSPLVPARQLLRNAYADNDGWWIGQSQLDDGFVVGAPDVFVEGGGFGGDGFGGDGVGLDPPVPGWALSLASMAALAAALFWLGCRRLRTPAETER